MQPPPNSFMSELKFIAETISVIILFAACLRRWWHATVAGSNLCAYVRVSSLTNVLLQNHKHGKMHTDLI